MKLTLVFDIYNKAHWLDGLLRSWLDTLSGLHAVEVIVVCDGCYDASVEVARNTLYGYPYPIQVVETPNVYEIKANNHALQYAAADSEWIVFIQDDNWIYDQGWDDLLYRIALQIEFNVAQVGCIGLLAGVYWVNRRLFHRVEVNRPHKGEHYDTHGIPDGTYPPAVYAVDFINRPFAIRTPLIREYGGLEEAYCPMDFDDTDLSLRLLRDGYTNIYIPFDLVNTCAKVTTRSREDRDASYAHGAAVFDQRHGDWLEARNGSFEMRPLMDLGMGPDRLVLP